MSPHAGEPFGVTQAYVDAFQREGAVVLRQLFQPREVELLKAGIDANLAHNGRLHRSSPD
jgi:hypothetical protein